MRKLRLRRGAMPASPHSSCPTSSAKSSTICSPSSPPTTRRSIGSSSATPSPKMATRTSGSAAVPCAAPSSTRPTPSRRKQHLLRQSAGHAARTRRDRRDPKHGEPNRQGTLYRVLIPDEIEACRKFRAERMAEETALFPNFARPASTRSACKSSNATTTNATIARSSSRGSLRRWIM